MVISVQTDFLLFLLLQYVQIIRGDADDLIESPIFDYRPQSKSLQDIQASLDLLQEKNNNDIDNKLELEAPTKSTPMTMTNDVDEAKKFNLKHIKKILSKFLSTWKRDKRKAKGGDSSRPNWHKWTDWSVCSVTCGKGRLIRWRHCQTHCEGIETEMEEMSCQLPECPRKLFGFLKLN